MQPGEEQAPERPYCSFSVYKRGLPEREREAFYQGLSCQARGNHFKLQQARVRLDTEEKCFRLRMVRCWHRLFKEAVAAPFLEVSKVR